RLDQVPIEERPGRIAVQHDHGLPRSLIDIVQAQTSTVEIPPAVFGHEFLQDMVHGRGHSPRAIHHSNASIMQLSPLPIPRNATRSPGSKNSRPSARPAVRGRETVPMLPRKGYVGKSFDSGSGRALRMASRCDEPTWWQTTLSTWSPVHPNRCKKACQVCTP